MAETSVAEEILSDIIKSTGTGHHQIRIQLAFTFDTWIPHYQAYLPMEIHIDRVIQEGTAIVVSDG